MRRAGDYILFHHTAAGEARSILDAGFRDDCGRDLSRRTWRGVWLSASPEEGGEGAEAGETVTVKLAMDEGELAGWEWSGEGRPARAWLIPAGVLNARVTGLSLHRPAVRFAEAAA
jgi:hypothetical protein